MTGLELGSGYDFTNLLPRKTYIGKVGCCGNQTLQIQDTSDPRHFRPDKARDTSVPGPKCPETLWSWD